MTTLLSDNDCALEIPRHLNDKRIDSALAALLAEKFPDKIPLSRSHVTRLINDGHVLKNGKPVLSRALVVTHDILTCPHDIFLDEAQSKARSQVVPERLTVLFENEQFFVIDKPAGIQMHEGGSYQGGTVSAWVVAHYPALSSVGEDPKRPGIVHRLDRDTSGVLVVAKNNETFQKLKQSFQDREVKKTYIALVYGHLRNRAGEVSASLMRHPGELKRRAIDPETYTGTLPGNTRTALTHYRVIARYEEYDLAELTPKTGRTHQLRVHMAYLGHPVVGDHLYAFKETTRKNLLVPERQLLHAAKLSFVLDSKQYQFQSPLPDDFHQILQSLDETKVSSYDDEALRSFFREL